MAALTGTAQAVAIGEGFEVRAPGIVGEARLAAPIPRAMRAPISGFDARSRGIEQALAAAHLVEVHKVELNVDAHGTALAPERALGAKALAPRATDAKAAARRGPTVEVTAPAPPPGHAQIVLARDRLGALTWHLPEKGAKVKKGKQLFVVPAPAAPRRAADARKGPQPERGLVSNAAGKVLQFLVYPILDPVLGSIEDAFAERWETANRPYSLRTFTPKNFRDADVPMLTREDFDKLAKGRALLFVHGTFSTAHGAFAEIADDTMRKLFDRYQGRVFAFNHFTLSHDPAQNARWFLQHLPADCQLAIDIVCHSRGGLVARELAEHAAGSAPSNVKVHRIVFAGVPNAGTPLADKDHMVDMIDRLTTIATLFPGPVTEILEGLITAVKILGHAGLAGLPGLASMDPAGAFLHGLNVRADVADEVYAIAADYEPTDAGLKALVSGSVDAAVDCIFDDAANDLVVPQLGVFEKNGGSSFPIPPKQVLEIDKSQGVMHTTLFSHKPACDKIVEWLTV